MFGSLKRRRGGDAPKRLRLSAEEIRPIVKGLGFCIATDRITVDGCKVGLMYRDPPSEPEDSGWCFFSTDESEPCLAKPENSGVYDVNTIANYDPEIVPLLDWRAGVAFKREAGTGKFVQVKDWEGGK